MEKVQLSFPLAKKNFMLARLMCGGVGGLMDYNIETVEDTKVAVNEACIILYMQGYRQADMVLELNDKMSVCVSGSDLDNTAKCDKDFSFAISLLGELVSGVVFEKENDRIQRIKFVVDGI